MEVKIAAIGLAHPFEVGFEHAGEWLEQTAEAIEKTGVRCIRTGIVLSDYETVMCAEKQLNLLDFDVVLVCVATWSEDHHLLDLLAFRDLPMIIRALPHCETGSLCCAHQIGAVFTEIGKRYEFVYGAAECRESAQKVKQIATAYALANKMGRMKTGAIGGRVKGMTEIAYDEFAIKQKLGARVINIDEQEMTDAVCEADDSAAREVVGMLQKRGYQLSSTEQDLVESAKYYLGLRELVDKYDLNCMAVKCYTKYMGKVCLGYSLLAGEGVMCACEGDVTNSLAMQMLYELSGRPVNNTDLLSLDERDNTILYSHCGSSGFSIADGEINIAPVRLAKRGCCCLFTALPGEVTLLNFVGHGDKFRISTSGGEAVRCGMEFPGNPVKVRHRTPITQINQKIMNHGIGHHWMVGYGDYKPVIQKFCEIKEVRYIDL